MFYCPHALNNSNQHIWVRKKTFEFSSTMSPSPSPHYLCLLCSYQKWHQLTTNFHSDSVTFCISSSSSMSSVELVSICKWNGQKYSSTLPLTTPKRPFFANGTFSPTLSTINNTQSHSTVMTYTKANIKHEMLQWYFITRTQTLHYCMHHQCLPYHNDTARHCHKTCHLVHYLRT